jgi:hypothetical protein
VNGDEAQGGDYLYMWTEILAGADGSAPDFDMVYFVGPSDVRDFFGYPRLSVLEAIETRLDEWGRRDPHFTDVAGDPVRRRAFIRYYGLRASVAYSKGAHDEWNIFVRINKKRGVGEQVAMWFDGRALSPAEMETEIAVGYEVR